jgi:tetratricopeptide (TPR) repeat protein
MAICVPVTHTVFLSFSGKDSALAANLRSILERQGLDVLFDYSRDGGGVPPGNKISESLKEEINQAHVFIPVISRASIDDHTGKWPRFETEYALAAKDASRPDMLILPVVLALNKSDWIAPYTAFRDTTTLNLRSQDIPAVEEAVKQIMLRLSRPYEPPLLGDPRIVFRQRILEELARSPLGSLGSGPDLGRRADYVSLLEKVDSFIAGASEPHPDWGALEVLIGELIRFLRVRRLGDHWYFVYVMKGLCQLQQDDRLHLAEATFLELTGRPETDIDAHAFAGLALVHFSRGNIDKAISAFERALKYGRGGNAWELLFNVIGARLSRGESIDLEPAVSGLDLQALRVDDWLKLQNLRALSFQLRGEFGRSVRILEEVHDRVHENERVADEVSAVLLYQSYLSLSDLAADSDPDESTLRLLMAISTLEREAGRQGSDLLYHHLARLYIECGELGRAVHVYSTILCVPPFRCRKYLVGLARLFASMHRRSKMREICALCTSPELGPPYTPEEFYYRGFAHFLLAKLELAGQDFRDGRSYCSTWYQEAESGASTISGGAGSPDAELQRRGAFALTEGT